MSLNESDVLIDETARLSCSSIRLHKGVLIDVQVKSRAVGPILRVAQLRRRRVVYHCQRLMNYVDLGQKLMKFDFNPLECKHNYRATSNNMKLVHWPLMGGLLHLVRQGGDWAGPQPA